MCSIEVLGKALEKRRKRGIIVVIIVRIVLVDHCGIDIFFVLGFGFRSPAGLFSLERGCIVVIVIVNDEGGVDVRFGQGRAGPARGCLRWIHGEERWWRLGVGASKMTQIFTGLCFGPTKKIISSG